MIFKSSQDTYDFTDLNTVKKIGIKISGGVDSAGVSYMIFKTIHEQNLDIEVVVITTDYETKSYQVEFSTKVIKWLQKEFPSVKVVEHITNLRSGDMDYSDTQDIILDQAYDVSKIERHYNGLTQNPPKEEHDKFEEGGTDWEDWETRHGKFEQWNGDHIHPGYRPFINTNKKGVAEIYDQFNLMEPGSLFEQTRSCEAYTDDFSSHCGKCWFCKEREWGFGRTD